VLCNQSAEALAVREVRQLGYPVTDDINILVQNIDTAFIDDGACEKVARKERGRVCRNIIVHHLDIDRVLLLKVGIQPWTCLPSRVKYKSNRHLRERDDG
jgi:hypothetical protein